MKFQLRNINVKICFLKGIWTIITLMIDKVTFELPSYYMPSHEFGRNEVMLYKGVEFHPERNKVSKQITNYVEYLRNLRLTVFELKIKISNSLPHFLYGCNAKDLNHEDLIAAIIALCDFWECEQNDLIVRFIEFGVSFLVSVPPVQIIQRLVAHKGGEIESKVMKTKLVGRKFDHHNYDFKAYDKGLEQKLQRENFFEGNILRLEQQLKYKHIPDCIVTAADLVKQKNIWLLFMEFKKQWRSIEKAPFVDTLKMSSSERDWYYARMNPLYWIDQESKNRNTAKIGKQRFKKKISEIGDFSIFQEVEQSFTKKFLTLISNERVPDFPRTIITGNRVHNMHKNDQIESIEQ